MSPDLPPPVSPEDLANAVCRVAPEVDRSSVEQFVARLDEGYRRSQPPEEVARHVAMAAALSPDRPAAVRALARAAGRFDVVVVAYDYFAELSFLCGLLAAEGLSIEAGEVHTLLPTPVPRVHPRRRGPRAPAAPSRQIVDIFRVCPRDPSRPPDADAIEGELVALLGLVAEGRTDAARERLSRRLTESLGRSPAPFAGKVTPVEIEFDDDASPSWTLMRVSGRDTPGFLYALANALAMRRVYIHAVRIESVGDEVRDEFLIGQAGGGKIAGENEQATLRLAIVLIKQFTHFLPWAPDPARALRYFDQFLDRVMTAGAGSEALRLLRGPDGLRSLAQLLGSSAFLWEDMLRTHFEHLAPVLGEWRTRPLEGRAELRRHLALRLKAAGSWEERKRALNDFKDETMLLADMKRLLDPGVSLESFSRALTDLAEAVLEEALAACRERQVAGHGRPRRDGDECPVAFLGLGKFGGAEMGYASDVELLIVYGGAGTTERTGIENGQFFEHVVHSLTEMIEAREGGIFHLDLRLRPHGAKGPLATPFAALRDYYRPGGDAHPFERQALVKLRFVAGDEPLGRAVEAFRDAYVWGDEPWDLAAALHLRDRQVRELVAPGRFNVKYSAGALVDVEYAAQYLQVLHGRSRPELRTPSTLVALDRLRDCGLLDAEEHGALGAAYRFWRQVADGLRMERGDARDLLLPEEGSEELRFLARRLGYGGTDWQAGARALADDVRRHREWVSAFFARRFRTGLGETGSS
jgi:glutamate-ammonia-ligase adenylyltransferase